MIDGRLKVDFLFYIRKDCTTREWLIYVSTLPEEHRVEIYKLMDIVTFETLHRR